jgi:DNA invertase Pin-like site-specific DNA recombinase
VSNRTELPLNLDLAEQKHVVAGQVVGYARVSTDDQNLARQVDQLKAAGAFAVYTEKISGSTRNRPQLEEVLRYLRRGDQLVVTSMDRLARSLVDLHAIVDDLVSRGVSVKFLREGQIYSGQADPIAKLMLGVMGSVAEFERAIIRERQAEGIAKAKKRGVYKGRARALTDEQVDEARRRVAEGIPKAKVARDLGIGRTTLYEYLNESKKSEG